MHDNQGHHWCSWCGTTIDNPAKQRGAHGHAYCNSTCRDDCRADVKNAKLVRRRSLRPVRQEARP